MTSPSTLTVLGRANSSNVQKVMWLLAEIGQSCHRVDMGGAFGGNREPEYLKKNPHGVVPTLIDLETVVWESNTIVRYLCNRFNARALYPDDVARRAMVERWMDWQLSTLGPANAQLFQSIVRTPAGKRVQELIDGYRDRNATLFAVLDQALDGHDYVEGNSLTLADIVLAPLTYRWFELPIERPQYTHLRRWYDLICQRPAFQEHVVGVGLS
ncbi:glutathione S-transferase [Cupriavidus pinatubonensis]|uniref:glutathione S-transferase family protein n=1 Tax=Cupriavidus pinatubonensis TaxID=248026 RepID=UPI00112B6907|nr:glutathione S-transferase [Cupriavidus pinatubonensis]QYY33046.1 glutathione S-transferase [Cupriavidus pinatubonensis]TPQ39140.1 glutathione S-transferase [Cupriavidus pinatubonensis]